MKSILFKYRYVTVIEVYPYHNSDIRGTIHYPTTELSEDLARFQDIWIFSCLVLSNSKLWTQELLWSQASTRYQPRTLFPGRNPFLGFEVCYQSIKRVHMSKYLCIGIFVKLWSLWNAGMLMRWQFHTGE